MRKPFVVAFVLAECIFATVIICAMVARPEPRGPDRCVVLLPVLMLADYYLTILYAWLVKRTFTTVDLTAVELNPMWKADVAKLRVVNFHHLAHVAFFTIVFLMLSQAPDGSPRALFLGLFGFAIGLSGMTVARHIRNLAILRILRQCLNRAGASVQRHPLDGERWSRLMGRPFPVRVLLMVAVLLVIAVFWLGPSFLLGSAAGLIAESAVQFGLKREARRSCEKVTVTGTQ